MRERDKDVICVQRQNDREASGNACKRMELSGVYVFHGRPIKA